MQEESSKIQISRCLIWKKNWISKKSYLVCFRNFQIDPNEHEKNSFKIIEVALRVLDVLRLSIDVTPICVSSSCYYKDQKKWTLYFKMILIYSVGTVDNDKTAKWVLVMSFGSNLAQSQQTL
jgi:hypothetical protein